MEVTQQAVLVHLSSGIGNIVLATPLLVALSQMEFIIDVLVHADYPQTTDLLRGWSIIREIYKDRSELADCKKYDYLIPAVPPFYWYRFRHFYRNDPRIIRRPPDSLFYQNEQEYYLAFTKKFGYPDEPRPFYRLPIGPAESFGVTGQTLVIAPGCKTGEMANKRWPYFHQLADAFDDVAIVGTEDDLRINDGTTMQFSQHVRLFTGKLTLRETAELIASAGAVLGNDSGLSHIAVAVGTPTVMLFGPTPHTSLGQLPSNVSILRTGLECEPCWFNGRFRACSKHILCLQKLPVERVAKEVTLISGIEGKR